MKSLSRQLSEVSQLVGNALADFLTRYNDPDFPELYNAMVYTVSSGGKRIRPFLTLGFCRLFGGSDDDALPFACAVEAVHNYSLIHDDLPCMDDDDIRRGKPSCHIAFGEATALLAGDALLTAAFEIIAESTANDAAKLQAVKLLAECAGASGMIGGQQLDLKEELSDSAKFTKMNLLKTGALIRAACLLGCIAVGLTKEDARWSAAQTFAERLGLAFQLTDDLLDRGTEDEKTTYLSFMTPEEARIYAKTLTDEAADAVAQYDTDGILRLFTEYIRNRTL